MSCNSCDNQFTFPQGQPGPQGPAGPAGTNGTNGAAIIYKESSLPLDVTDFGGIKTSINASIPNTNISVGDIILIEILSQKNSPNTEDDIIKPLINSIFPSDIFTEYYINSNTLFHKISLWIEFIDATTVDVTTKIEESSINSLDVSQQLDFKQNISIPDITTNNLSIKVDTDTPSPSSGFTIKKFITTLFKTV